MNQSIQKFEIPQNEIASVEVMPSIMGGKRLELTFKNGFGLSILADTYTYSNGINTFEVATLKDGKIWTISDDEDGVYGWQTEADITLLAMKMIAMNKLTE